MSLSRNLEYAQYGIEMCREKFPMGAFDRVDVHSKFIENGQTEILKQQIILNTTYRELKVAQIINGSLSASEKKKLQILMQDIKSGLVVEFIGYTQQAISEKYAEARVEIVNLDTHRLLVIGRDSTSPIDSISEWGSEAVLCDPWANQYYPATEFLTRQQGEDIPRCVTTTDAVVGGFITVHYNVECPSSLEKNLEYAEYGLAICKKLYPYGGLNRIDVFTKYQEDFGFVEQLSL